MPRAHPAKANRHPGTRRVFTACGWLAVVLVGAKACFLGLPDQLDWTRLRDLVWSLAAISYVDVLFAAAVWAAARVALAIAGERRVLTGLISYGVVCLAAASCVYAVASIVMFGTFGGFLTYPLLALVGDVQMLTSSVAAYLKPSVLMGLILVPLAYLGLVGITLRLGSSARMTGRSWRPIAVGVFGLWVVCGHHGYSTTWATRQDRRIAQNPQWVLASSWWQVVSGLGNIRMAEPFAPTDLADFAPFGQRPPSPSPRFVRRVSLTAPVARVQNPQRPLNVILVVLESVAARWSGLSGGLYPTTPVLQAESARSLIVDNFYAHIGRSSNSLAAMLLSTYPKLGFRDITEEYPRLRGTSLASVFRERGYRTAFLTPSRLSWAGWETFLEGRGFEQLRDDDDLACSAPISSWGVEDRCVIEGLIDFLHHDAGRPFFLMAWTQQTHHPYDPTPGIPLLDFRLESSMPDEYDLQRYMNVLHETDRQLARLFDAIRQAGLDRNTLVVVTGDHGQAFGYPHNSYGQGRTAYEEDIHVPLMFWFPPRFPTPARSKTVGSQVDLAPTIADLVGLPPAPDWQGRSLLDRTHPPRAYFYVAEDEFTLGVREDSWKYILNLREGTEELYDLDHDPAEQRNLSKDQPVRSARLRQRLAAWTEANRRKYELSPEGPQGTPRIVPVSAPVQMTTPAPVAAVARP